MDIERIKQAVDIAEIVESVTDYELHGRRGYLTPAKGTKEGGLVINGDTQLYYWNARGRGGDVITFLEQEIGMSFKDALRYLAACANIPLQLTETQEKAYKASRKREDIFSVVAGHGGPASFENGNAGLFQEMLFASPAALAWAAKRGFTEETLKAAHCGFWDGNRKALLSRLQLHGHDPSGKIAQALAGIPAGMFIYAHFFRGRCIYLSGRSISEKRHYNPPRDLVGEKQPYFNHVFNGKPDQHLVIVEGQADANTLAQWELPAIALAGANMSPDLIASLKGYESIYIALDDDDAGRENAAKIAKELGPLTKIVTWPAHDANDWLQNGGAARACRQLLAASPIYAEWLAMQLGKADPLDRNRALIEAQEAISRLPGIEYANRKKHLAALLGQSQTELNQAVKEHKKKREASQKRRNNHDLQRLPGGYIDGVLFEMFLDESEPLQPVTRFAVRAPAGDITIKNDLEFENGYAVAPFPASEDIISKKSVLFSPAPMPFESEAALIERIKSFIHTYVDLSPEFESISAYYAVFSWLFDAFPRVPY